MTTVSVTSKLLKKPNGVVRIVAIQANNYSSDDRIYNLSSLKRGTGGRSSFNGIVATVFGATGFIGRGDNYEPMRLKQCGDLGQVYFHPYHLRDEESIAKCVRYSNVVINLVGRDWETKNFKYDDVHVDGARRLARIAKQAGVERFIHLSALNASETPEEGGVIKGGSRFLRSKAKGEQAVLEEFPEATIFRPADVYGQEDRFLRFYVHPWRRNTQYMPVWNKGEKAVKQPVWVGDLAAGIIAAVKDPDAAGKIYQAVGPKRYLLSELIDYFYRVMRKDEEWGYRRYDMRYDPLFQLRVTLTEKLCPNWPIGYLHWEKIEMESLTDNVRAEVPTLEDLGVNVINIEERIHWELKPWVYAIYRGQDVDEPLAAAKAPPTVA